MKLTIYKDDNDKNNDKDKIAVRNLQQITNKKTYCSNFERKKKNVNKMNCVPFRNE